MEWWQGTVLGKLVLLAVLILALQIPIHWIHELVGEREANRAVAVQEVQQSAGGARMPRGPVLRVPYRPGRSGFFNPDESATKHRYATLRPRTLAVRGTIDPIVRTRGVFDVLLYRTTLQFDAVFDRPDPSELGISDEQIVWEGIRLTFDGKDLPGVVTVDGADVALEESIRADRVGAPVDASAGLSATYTLDVSGSGRLSFWAPDRVTSVELESVWPHPKFVGVYLPETRDVASDGFRAAWTVDPGVRPRLEASETTPSNEALWFGVALIQPVDAYRMTRRAMKYQFLFTSLTLGVLFLTEIFERLRIHPIQYLLVGCALAMFYLLMLSLSEHLTFGASYGIAACGVLALVWSYAHSVLAEAGRAAVIGGGLTCLYGFLFVLLALQDYSLLFGSLGLFVLLAFVMFFTRNVDWYGLSGSGREAEARSSGTLFRE